MALDLSMLDEPEASMTLPDTAGRIQEIALDEIEEDSDQPRKTFTQESLDALAAQIRRKGRVVVPITVRPKRDGKYRIVDGARRYRSSRIVGMTTIRAIVEADESTIDAYTQVVVNLQRESLKPTELAQFIEDRVAAGDTLGGIAEQLGIGADVVSAHRALFTAPACILAAFEAEQIKGVSGVYELCRLHEQAAQEVEAFLSSHADQEITRSMIRRLGETIRNPQPVAPTTPPGVDADTQQTSLTPQVASASPSGNSVAVAQKTNAADSNDASAGKVDDTTAEVSSGTTNDATGEFEDGSGGTSETPVHEVPYHNPDIEREAKPPKIDDPSRIRKPLLLANYEGEPVMVRLDRMPTTPGLAFVKYEDGRGEIEIELGLLRNWTLSDSKV